MGFGIKQVTKRLGTAALLPLIVLGAVIAASALSAASAVALDGEEQAFLGLINQYRAQNGLGGLSLDGQLNDASKWMSQDMCAKNYFSHTDSLGRDPFARMAAFGYNYNTWKGENLAAGTNPQRGADILPGPTLVGTADGNRTRRLTSAQSVPPRSELPRAIERELGPR